MFSRLNAESCGSTGMSTMLGAWIIVHGTARVGSRLSSFVIFLYYRLLLSRTCPPQRWNACHESTMSVSAANYDLFGRLIANSCKCKPQYSKKPWLGMCVPDRMGAYLCQWGVLTRFLQTCNSCTVYGKYEVNTWSRGDSPHHEPLTCAT